MIRVLARVLLISIAFMFLLPKTFTSIEFHGGTLTALGFGLFFSLAYYGIGSALSLSFERFFGGLEHARKFVPLWVAIFWAVSAGLIKLTAFLLPTVLSVYGWAAAIGAGLVLLVIGVITAGSPCKKSDSSSSSQ